MLRGKVDRQQRPRSYLSKAVHGRRGERRGSGGGRLWGRARCLERKWNRVKMLKLRRTTMTTKQLVWDRQGNRTVGMRHPWQQHPATGIGMHPGNQTTVATLLQHAFAASLASALQSKIWSLSLCITFALPQPNIDIQKPPFLSSVLPLHPQIKVNESKATKSKSTVGWNYVIDAW